MSATPISTSSRRLWTLPASCWAVSKSTCSPLTGDVHGDHDAPIARSAGLLAAALDGVRVRGHRIAVLGNHDPVEMADALGRTGFEVLINRSLVLQRDGESLRITGLDDVNSLL